MKITHNQTGRSGKNFYRVFSDHKTKLNGSDEPETVKITLNNSYHTMDGDLEAGWSVTSINTETKVYKMWTDAADHFEDMTGERPPKPGFEPKWNGVTVE